MRTSKARTWRLVLPAAATAVALGATGAVAVEGVPAPARPAAPGGAAQVRALLGAAAPAGVDLAAVDLARPPQGRLPRPATAAQLDAAVAATARSMGVPAPGTALGDLPPVVRGGLVEALSTLSACAATTRAAVAALGGTAGLALAVQQQAAPDPEVTARLRGCAVDVRQALAGLELAVRSEPGRASAAAGKDCGPTTAAWPVLALDLEGTDTCYARDYALVVDAGGDDLYDNNAGANMIDLQVGRSGERARGCRTAVSGLLARDCTPLAAALLDLEGDDRYGLPEEPLPDLVDPLREGDARCTREEVVARFMTQGAGLLGVGVLVDVLGDDRYRGKTGAQGAGHVGGVGLLQDLAGDDRYVAVRNAQGFALVGGVGVLADTAGDDRYTFRMPAPIEGGLPLEGPAGNGGVIDDVGRCDAIPRFLQGAANVGGVGVLVDSAGRDRYEGAGTDNTGEPDLPFRATGSQGFGSNGALGVMLDLSSGVRDHYSGQPARGDEHVHVDCSVSGAGLFADLGTGSAGTCATAPPASRTGPASPEQPGR